MKNQNTANELISLQNFANKFNLKVKLWFEEDKRKKQRFFLVKNKTSISGVLDYTEMNCFLLGINVCKNYQI